MDFAGDSREEDADNVSEGRTVIEIDRRRGRGAVSNASGRFESLARFAEATFAKAYRLARKEAARQTHLDLPAFPADPPFSLGESLEPDLWPEAERGTE